MTNTKTKETTPLSPIEGLILRGSVAGRLRRKVGEKNTDLITYKIFADGKAYFVKDWAPKNYFNVGSLVELPITIKTFQKNGNILIDYTISYNTIMGEAF
jgi:hypothetical protein